MPCTFSKYFSERSVLKLSITCDVGVSKFVAGLHRLLDLLLSEHRPRLSPYHWKTPYAHHRLTWWCELGVVEWSPHLRHIHDYYC